MSAFSASLSAPPRTLTPFCYPLPRPFGHVSPAALQLRNRLQTDAGRCACRFLSRALIPLHKPSGSCIQQYHQQLSYCITQYLEKDPKLADIILRGLIKYWPHTNSSKEVMFLNELEELLELTQSPDFAKVAEPLFRLIARCINSPHFQVAERALFLWNNEYIVSLIAKSRDVILPVLYPALEANTTKHWNSTVHGLTFNVQKLFMDMDARLWEDCTQRHKLNMERCDPMCICPPPPPLPHVPSLWLCICLGCSWRGLGWLVRGCV